jgi:hypothetical protein
MLKLRHLKSDWFERIVDVGVEGFVPVWVDSLLDRSSLEQFVLTVHAFQVRVAGS